MGENIKYKFTYINLVFTFVFVLAKKKKYDSMRKIRILFLRKVKMKCFIVKIINALWTQFYDRMSSMYCLCNKEKYVYVCAKVVNSSII